MKKVIVVGAALILSLPLTAMAENTGPGCGAGTIVFKGQSGLVPNVLAATTNGISGNQSFGMTFGTLGCDAEKVVSNEYQKEIFVASNMDTLAKEAAQGKGNHLASLAELIGIQSQNDRVRFYTLTQEKYDTVFSENNIDATTVIASIDSEMRSDAVLSQYAK